MRLSAWVLAPCLALATYPLIRGQAPKTAKVNDSRMPTGHLIKPLGASVAFPARPVDLVASPDGKRLYVKENRGLTVIDVPTGRVLQELPVKGGASLHGIALSPNGKTLLFTDAASGLHLARVEGDKVEWVRVIPMPKPPQGEAYPTGVTVLGGGKIALVCLSRKNSVVAVEIPSGRILQETPVEPAPYAVRAVRGDPTRAVVSCWGRTPAGSARRSPSSGTEVEVDAREVATGGTVCVIEADEGKVRAGIPVGLQPSGIVVDKDGLAYVANANSDTVSVIDPEAGRLLREIVVKPDRKLPFGSAPNALALSPDERTLYVACGGNNAVAVVRREGARERVVGFFPTGWYPSAVAPTARGLAVANAKGVGSRAKPATRAGRSVYDFLGTVSLVPAASLSKLSEHTKKVLRDAEVPRILAARERSTARGLRPVPVPKRLGDPSVFEHVVYVLKENRTYDQVFGDIEKGDGDPKLCIFGREITPNHHALAEEFVLLDNYYCNGVNSADGHAWSVEGNATSYFEKSFGGWTRSYPFGDDPLSVSTTGFLWDNLLGHGRSFRNYGEFDYATPRPPNASFTDIYRDFTAGTRRITFDQNIGVRRLAAYSNRESPGWNMRIPDILRADAFLRDLREFERKGSLPNLSLVYLPQDHTSGTQPGMPTPRAHMADNDLALGRIVEALSKSRFWPKTVVFVIEDDPQDGFDHIDGHRSLCLVVSPYSRRDGTVVSEFYNQTSVLHTMQRILGVRPMNAMDARSSLMSACFTSRPNLTPYTTRPNRVPLDELNPPLKALAPAQRKWAEASLRLELDRPDEGEDDLLNRILWHNRKGIDARYPVEWAGAHGRGLRGKGLKHGPAVIKRD